MCNSPNGHGPAVVLKSLSHECAYLRRYRFFSIVSTDCLFDRAQYDRPTELGELEISVTPRISLTRAIVKQFVDLGVHRLIVMPPSSLNESQLQKFVTNIGETLI
jgi:hypothetical protein